MSREDLVEVQEQEDIEIEGPEGNTINENIDAIEDEEGNLLAGEEALQLLKIIFMQTSLSF